MLKQLGQLNKDTGQDLKVAVPIVLGTAASVFANEYLGYDDLFGIELAGTAHLGSYPIFCLGTIVAALIIWRLCRRRGATLLDVRLLASAFALSVAGVACTAISILLEAGQDLSLALAITGFSILTVTTTVLLSCMLEVLSRQTYIERLREMLAAFLLSSLASPITHASRPLSLGCAAVAIIVGFGCLWLVMKADGSLRGRSGSESAENTTAGSNASPKRRFRSNFSPKGKAFVGFLLTGVAISYLNPLEFIGALPDAGSACFIIATHLAGTLLFAIPVLFLQDSSYNLQFRVINTMAIAAFLTMATGGMRSSLYPALDACTYTAFNQLLMFIVTDMCSFSAKSVPGVIACYLIALAGTSLAGFAMGSLEYAFVSSNLSGDPFSPAALAAALMVVVSALWLMTDKSLTEFFWEPQGTTEQAQNSEYSAIPIPERVARIEQSFSLTPREGQILGLLAVGRSSTYIAEQLGISSNTVRKRISSIYDKCGVHSRQELLSIILDQ